MLKLVLLEMAHEPVWWIIGGGYVAWVMLDIYFRRRGWL